MSYIETGGSWDYVGITVYPLDENGQRILLNPNEPEDPTYLSYYLRDFGLYKVSNSNRQNDTLVPTLKHTTVEVPGGDGMYWFGSQHTQKPIPIKFAYDDLREENLHILRWLFDGKKHLHVIFDEYPYKYYDMVVSSAPQFDYVPFTEDRVIDGVVTPRRIFKGEGSVQLTSYLPYAIGTIKYWDKTEPPQDAWANWDELQGTTKILTHTAYNSKAIGVWNVSKAYSIWNAGDLSCDFTLKIDVAKVDQIKLIRIFIRTVDGTPFELGRFQVDQANPFPASEITGSLTFDSKLHLVYDEAGKYYNKYLISETLFTPIPPVHNVYQELANTQYLYVNDFSNQSISLEGYSDFKYNYRFF